MGSMRSRTSAARSAAAAMDQRGSLRKAIAKAKGSDVDAAELGEFKAIVSGSPDAVRDARSCWTRSMGWRRLSGARRARASCSPMRRRGMTRRSRAACRICSPSGRCGGSSRRARTSSRSCSTTIPTTIRRSTRQARLHRARRGGVPRRNDVPFFLEPSRLQRRGWRRKGPRLRARQAGQGDEVHGGSSRSRATAWMC